MAYLRFMLMVAMMGSSSAASAQDALLKVRFATDWKAQAEQGGFYQAKALGLYEKARLMSRYAEAAGINIPHYWALARLNLAWGRTASFRSTL